ncbi:uncharacterized protein BDW47DRAFT_113375 [Aspergillus candidus]|uniref:Uncharacterized protein n=1 Tax=Aspergillus candidus TaxID=41067 RepID=A0A2I2EZL3_ASPCN|nr:hypothetical protein BDW47DRAFT_113375 [Aspergillus candidus]PLB33808.1 hypothetical protein BDW47DRAFT_113375 [Aspergillus candidus]
MVFSAWSDAIVFIILYSTLLYYTILYYIALTFRHTWLTDLIKWMDMWVVDVLRFHT